MPNLNRFCNKSIKKFSSDMLVITVFWWRERKTFSKFILIFQISIIIYYKDRLETARTLAKIHNSEPSSSLQHSLKQGNTWYFVLLPSTLDSASQHAYLVRRFLILEFAITPSHAISALSIINSIICTFRAGNKYSVSSVKLTCLHWKFIHARLIFENDILLRFVQVL